MVRTLGKIVFTIALIFALCAVFYAATEVADASASAERYCADFDEVKNIGYDLGEYDALLSYYYYTLNTSGVYIAYEITLDKNFLLRVGTSEDRVYRHPEAFAEIETLFKNIGYSVNIDKYNGKISASLKFDSTTDYYIATGRDGYEVYESNPDKDAGFLYTDYHTTTKTVFSRIGEENTIVDVLYKKCLALGVTEDKLQLAYVYGTPYKIIYSDAQEHGFDSSNGVHKHVFKMSVADKDKEIHLTQHSPNAWGFYVLAIICVIPIVTVPVVIGIKERKKKEDNNAR